MRHTDDNKCSNDRRLRRRSHTINGHKKHGDTKTHNRQANNRKSTVDDTHTQKTVSHDNSQCVMSVCLLSVT